MSVIELHVTGMTCHHCVKHVEDEIREVAQPESITIDLVKGGVSTVTITSAEDISDEVLAEAIDEAGNYSIVETIRR